MDQTIDQCVSAARLGGPDALARLVLAASLAERASVGQLRRALATVGKGPGPIADQARWLAKAATPAPLGEPWRGLESSSFDAPPDPDGLVRTFAILGPFEDTGGGLARREGPESSAHDYRTADYSWGAYQVRYRRSLPSSATARGVPLDLYIHPREESCTYLESAVRIPGPSSAPATIVVHLAAAGSFRLLWDGVPIASSEQVHRALVVDRAAVRMTSAPGDHLLTVKVCSTALLDAGRVRVRFTDEGYRPLALATSSELGRLQAVRDGLQSAGVDARPVAVQFEPLTTPLEQALRLGDSASRQQLLVASLVRTLGGADDVHSPRAPGLLDRLIGAGQVPLDLLALAGFIAPSAANRSGWLQQALVRARAEGDHTTASWAQRALVESRLAAGMTDLAHATALEPPLRDADDAHARWLKASVLIGLGGRGLRAAALAQLLELAQAQAGETPIVVWRSLVQLSDNQRPDVLLRAVEQLSVLRPGHRGPAYVNAFRSHGAEALQQAALQVLAHQSDGDDLITIGETLLAGGKYAAALRAFELAAELSPNRDAGFRGLAKTQQLVDPAGRPRPSVMRALGRARELRPHQAQLAAEMKFRESNGAGRTSAATMGDADDLQYIVEPAVFLARARAKPAVVGAQFARELHYRRVVTLHPDKRVSQLMHYAREIVVEPRTESERYEGFPPSTGPTELLVARVHRSDGTVLAPEEQDNPDRGSPKVRWPKLKRGDVVELAIRLWTAGPIGRRGDIPFYFVDYSGSLDTRPVLYNEVVIDTPRAGSLAFDVINGEPDRRLVTEREGRRITRLIWDEPAVVPDEPLAAPLSELVPVTVGSQFPTWEAFLAWYRGAVEGFTEPDEQIKRLARELTAGKVGREQQVEALFNFVADDIRYVNYVSGEWWLPNRPHQLLARRQGDCDDKAMLLISLLSAVGIEATEVLIQTRYTGQPGILRSQRAAIPMFDHGIIFLPGVGGAPGRFLDATTPQSRIGSLPSMDTSAIALLVGEGPVQVVSTPAAAASAHGVQARWQLSLTSSGAGEIRATERHLGDAALMLRTRLEQADARAQFIEQYLVAGWFPTVQVGPTVAFDGNLPGGAASLEYSLRSESLARREGDELVVVVAPSMPMTARLAPLTKRTLPVVLPPGVAPYHRHLVIEIEAPPSLRFADLPPDAVADGKEFGRASVSFAQSGAGRRGRPTVTIRREVSFERSRIEVRDYARWRSWLQRIDRLYQRGVRLVPK